MALSTQVLAAILTELAATSPDAVQQQIQNAYLTQKLSTARTALDQAIVFTVTDWTKLQAFLTAGVSNTALYKLRASIDAKMAAKESVDLGVLLVTFYAAAKAHLGATPPA
jgi:hypothetical protein